MFKTKLLEYLVIILKSKLKSFLFIGFSFGGYVVVDREKNFSILTTCTGKKLNSHVHFGGRN